MSDAPQVEGLSRGSLLNARVCYDCGCTVTDPEAIDCPRCFATDLRSRHSRPQYSPPLRRHELGFPFSVEVAPGATILLSGDKGVGKTKSCCRLFAGSDREKAEAPSLWRPGRLRRGVWLTSEQEAEQVKDTWYDTHGVDADPPCIVYVTSWEHALGEFRALEPGEIGVLDSISQLGASTEEVTRLMRASVEQIRRSQAIGVLIAQFTKDGDPAGSNMLAHMVDAVARMARTKSGLRKLVWDKNRFGKERTTFFAITDRGVVPQQWQWAYSVEGPVGDYELVPYPTSSPKPQWADPLDSLAEARGKAPFFPIACAGRSCSLYPTGFLEPPDVDQRRAFAASCGVGWLELEIVGNAMAEAEAREAEEKANRPHRRSTPSPPSDV